MNSKIKMIIILTTLVLSGLACGLIDIGIEKPSEEAPESTIPDEVKDPTLSEDDSQIVDIESTAHPNTQYWKYVEDSRFGVRFAVPCFWSVKFLTSEQDPSGMGSFPVQNFDDAYISRLGPKRGDTVWQYGGVKLDIGYLEPSTWDLPLTASLEDLAQAMYNNDDPNPESFLTQMERVSYNGQESLQVTTQSTFGGEGNLYLFKLKPNLVLLLGPGPNSTGHPDIEAILSSIALNPDVEVQLPAVRPSDPPIGMGAECLGIEASEIPPLEPTTEDEPLTGTLECSSITENDSLWVACNIQDSIRSRNTQPLPGYMGNEFLVGYWQSEGSIMNPFEGLAFIEQQLPADTGKMSFTTDEMDFPPLLGMTPEQLMNPEANIVEVIYSEGWGADGQGAALLYLAENDNGEIYFYAMVIAQTHFDK